MRCMARWYTVGSGTRRSGQEKNCRTPNFMVPPEVQRWCDRRRHCTQEAEPGPQCGSGPRARPWTERDAVKRGIIAASRARGEPAMPEAISPFTINVPDDELEDLRRRLRATRWPERELVDDWSQGVPLAWIQDVCAYWADGYDWRAREKALNRFTQFVTPIDGVDVHFIHVRSPHEGALPLVMTHGWPGSIVEFHKVIEPLADPTAHGGQAEDAFHVVCPSLPGYGFSGKPPEKGWGVDRIGDAW